MKFSLLLVPLLAVYLFIFGSLTQFSFLLIIFNNRVIKIKRCCNFLTSHSYIPSFSLTSSASGHYQRWKLKLKFYSLFNDAQWDSHRHFMKKIEKERWRTKRPELNRTENKQKLFFLNCWHVLILYNLLFTMCIHDIQIFGINIFHSFISSILWGEIVRYGLRAIVWIYFGCQWGEWPC